MLLCGDELVEELLGGMVVVGDVLMLLCCNVVQVVGVIESWRSRLVSGVGGGVGCGILNEGGICSSE
eukprot:12411343-Karenia_brevis.AAC.1